MPDTAVDLPLAEGPATRMLFRDGLMRTSSADLSARFPRETECREWPLIVASQIVVEQLVGNFDHARAVIASGDYIGAIFQCRQRIGDRDATFTNR